MRRSFVTIAVLLAFALLAVMIGQNVTDAQRPGRPDRPGPPRGGMQFGPQALIRGMSFDRTWMLLSFELDTADDQLVKARTAYLKAWNDIREYGDAMHKEMRDLEGPDARDKRKEMFEEMRTKAKGIQSELDASLKEILTDEQYQKLVKVRTAEQKRMRQQMRRARDDGGGPRGSRKRTPPPR